MFHSERKKVSTSVDSPRFPNGFFERLLFHLTLNRTFRVFFRLIGKYAPFSHLIGQDPEHSVTAFFTRNPEENLLGEVLCVLT